jgi:hypothetical protein
MYISTETPSIHAATVNSRRQQRKAKKCVTPELLV